MTAAAASAVTTTTTPSNKNTKLNHKSIDPRSTNKATNMNKSDYKAIDTTNDNNDRVHHETQKHPTILVPTMSSIMKDRLSNYQKGQLGHFNWIVTQYLLPQQQQQQQQRHLSQASSSKRSRMVYEEHGNIDDKNKASTHSKQPQGTVHETASMHHVDTVVLDQNNVNTAFAKSSSNPNKANSTESIKDTDDYKRARDILNQYVDQMRGINTVVDKPINDDNDHAN
jgi:hypothetical protein